MPPVRVICRTRSLGRDHRGSKRMFRRALLSKSRTLHRFLHPSQNEAADTFGRFLSIDLCYVENALGVVVAEFILQLVSAFRNRADASPLPVADIKYLVD